MAAPLYRYGMTEEKDRPDRSDSSVDRSVIRELLKLTPAERARLAVEEARNLAAFDARLEVLKALAEEIEKA